MFLPFASIMYTVEENPKSLHLGDACNPFVNRFIAKKSSLGSSETLTGPVIFWPKSLQVTLIYLHLI